MIENIKQIGLFMIVAQTFLHFTAGQAYEKYVKIITGVIILLLFVRPFSAGLGNTAEQLQEELNRLTEQIENQSDVRRELPGMEYGAADEMVRQLEETVKRKLEQECMSGDFEITDVTISFATEQEEVTVSEIRVCLHSKSQEDPADPAGIGNIRIDPVSVADSSERGRKGEEAGTEEELDEKIQEYRSRFAESLGIEKEQVEVMCDGRK